MKNQVNQLSLENRELSKQFAELEAKVTSLAAPSRFSYPISEPFRTTDIPVSNPSNYTPEVDKSMSKYQKVKIIISEI